MRAVDDFDRLAGVRSEAACRLAFLAIFVALVVGGVIG